MSFDTDPDLYAFDTGPNPCNNCFAATKTPSSLFVSLQGIQPGDAWAPGDGPSLNGVFELPYTALCTWELIVGVITIRYQSDLGPGSGLVASNAAGFHFGAVDGASCAVDYPNGFNNPVGRKFWNGTASLLNPLDSGTLNNIDLMALIAMLPESGTFCSFSTPGPDLISTRYSRRFDNSNIHVKYDFT